MFGFSVILHPTDLSECSMAAFRMACQVAQEGTRIIILHVMEDSLASREGYLESLNRRLHELAPLAPVWPCHTPGGRACRRGDPPRGRGYLVRPHRHGDSRKDRPVR